jgi:hypothetical protein
MLKPGHTATKLHFTHNTNATDRGPGVPMGVCPLRGEPTRGLAPSVRASEGTLQALTGEGNRSIRAAPLLTSSGESSKQCNAPHLSSSHELSTVAQLLFDLTRRSIPERRM